MTAPNVSHQSGQARAFITHEPFSQRNKLFVTLERAILHPSGSSIVLEVPPPELEVTTLGPEWTLFEWTDQVEDQVIDMFKAMAKALEIYSDEPSKAYQQGLAEGEAKVLREWNESLRGG